MANQDPRAALIAKALTDPAFKAELLKNPNAAVEKATGVKVPAGVTIKIVEDTASAVHLVLPGSAKSGSLSDDELGKVAGGAGGKQTLWCDCSQTGSCKY